MTPTTTLRKAVPPNCRPPPTRRNRSSLVKTSALRAAAFGPEQHPLNTSSDDSCDVKKKMAGLSGPDKRRQLVEERSP